MSRVITVGAAQLGPIQRADSRRDVVERMLALMHKAHARGCTLVVFPELALTTFFPRWMMKDQAEVDGWFETAMPAFYAAGQRDGADDPLYGGPALTAMEVEDLVAYLASLRDPG